VFCSRKEVREHAFEEVERWLAYALPPPRRNAS
jgi:hypothetical protein